MSFRHTLRNVVERAAGVYIYKDLPRGIELLRDLRIRLSSFQPGTVFDVGANVGQSARRFRTWFPSAEIYTFEPAPEAFNALKAEVAGDNRIHPHQMAMGASPGYAPFLAEGTSEMNRVCSSPQAGGPTVQVEIRTLDDFTKELAIPTVSFLKIDTEGRDLDVLCGAKRLLESSAVDLLQVEAGMHHGNTHHVNHLRFYEYLEPLGYSLFGVYDQAEEWPTHERRLRRANLVFMSRRLVEATRG